MALTGARIPRPLVERRDMKPIDYKTILASIEQALAICDQSEGFMDAVHRKICEDLHDARTQLIRLMGSIPNPPAR